MASPATSPGDSTAGAPHQHFGRVDSFPGGIGAALGAAPSVSSEDDRFMKISLQLEAKNLPNMDKRGKSDPFVVLYKKIEAGAREEWVKIGQTETVYNNLSPQWATHFSMEYRFGSNFVLRFSIYDRDSKDDDLAKQDYIGEVRCTVAQVVLADNQLLTLPVQKSSSRPGAKLGTLTIRGEEEKGDLGDSVTFQFAATGLRRGRKPFYVLSRKNPNDNSFSPVAYSEVHQSYNAHNLTTLFKPITKSLAKLVNGDMDREIKIEFYDYDRRGDHYRGGSVKFTLRSARSFVASAGPAGSRHTLRKRKSNQQVVDAGILIIKRCDISIPYSFLDYIRSGTVINLIVAVDMSATNGNPADPSSLQYSNRQAPNEYVIALREVGQVLAAYDTSKTFPAFGFGAALPPSYNETAHCFALTGNIMHPVCQGVEGVIDTYYSALNNVAPYEPCLYGPLLRHVIKMTKEEDGRDRRTVYTVLLLVTDGDFQDFPDVANLICSAADLPLSIVIVGVGNSRFVQLEKLDGDDTPLCSTDGTPCARDIVQFVQFHKHRYNPAQLAKEVLDEIPEQMVSYMRSKSLKPDDIIPHNEMPAGPHAPGQPSGPYIPAAAQGNPTRGPIIPQSAAPSIGLNTSTPPGMHYMGNNPYSYAAHPAPSTQSMQHAHGSIVGQPSLTGQGSMGSHYSMTSAYHHSFANPMPPPQGSPPYGHQGMPQNQGSRYGAQPTGMEQFPHNSFQPPDQ